MLHHVQLHHVPWPPFLRTSDHSVLLAMLGGVKSDGFHRSAKPEPVPDVRAGAWKEAEQAVMMTATADPGQDGPGAEVITPLVLTPPSIARFLA